MVLPSHLLHLFHIFLSPLFSQERPNLAPKKYLPRSNLRLAALLTCLAKQPTPRTHRQVRIGVVARDDCLTMGPLLRCIQAGLQECAGSSNRQWQDWNTCSCVWWRFSVEKCWWELLVFCRAARVATHHPSCKELNLIPSDDSLSHRAFFVLFDEHLTNGAYTPAKDHA